MRATLLFGIAVLTCLGLLGCDSDSLDDFVGEERELVITTKLELNPLCRTVVDSLYLFAGADLLGKARVDVGAEVTFESVRIPPGQVGVELTVDVFSINGSLIYEADLQPVVGADDFEFVVVPTAISPVMEVCIPDDSQSFVIKNRGRGSLRFQLLPEGPACLSETPSCLVFTPSDGVVAEDDSVTVTYSVNSDLPESIDLHIKSNEGGIWIQIVPSASTGKRDMVVFRSHTSAVR